MTAPAGGWRDNKGYLHLPGGYDQARSGQAPSGASQPATVPQQPPFGSASESPLQARGPIVPETPPLIQQSFTQQPWQQQPGQQPGQQPATQPQQPAASPQQVQTSQTPPAAGADLSMRVSGPNIPAELQGRTVGEIIGIANGLRQVHLQQSMQPQVQVPAQPAQPPAQAPGAPQPFDWRKPDESIGRVVDERVNNIIQTRLAPMLAPVALQGQIQAASMARNVAANEIPGFAQIEPMVHQKLNGMAPEALANPETWRIAAKMVIGEQAIQRQYQTTGQAQVLQPGQFPPQNPSPNLNTFFTEQPFQGGAVTQGGGQLSAEQMAAASAMGMSYADYSAWAGGAPRGAR